MSFRESMINMEILKEYQEAAEQRQSLGVPPLPLSVAQVTAVIESLPQSSGAERQNLLYLLRERVNPGVDEAAGSKADFLAEVISGRSGDVGISALEAVQWLGLMRGGYNLTPLLETLDDKRSEVAAAAIYALKHTLLVYDAFAWVVEKFKKVIRERVCCLNHGLKRSGSRPALSYPKNWC